MAGLMLCIRSPALQLVSSRTESIFTRCSAVMPRSSYIRKRGDIRGGRFDMTRSAEKPRTPPTSTAPSRNMSACCLERCTDFSLVTQNETKDVGARLRSLWWTLHGGRFHRSTGDGRRLEQLRVGVCRVRLIGAEHGETGGENQDRGGQERRPEPAIELRPPPELHFGDSTHDPGLELVPVGMTRGRGIEPAQTARDLVVSVQVQVTHRPLVV